MLVLDGWVVRIVMETDNDALPCCDVSSVATRFAVSLLHSVDLRQDRSSFASCHFEYLSCSFFFTRRGAS